VLTRAIQRQPGRLSYGDFLPWHPNRDAPWLARKCKRPDSGRGKVERVRQIEEARPPSCPDVVGGFARRRKCNLQRALWLEGERDRHFLCDL